MRKELVLFIPSTEQEEEVSIRTSIRNKKLVMISHGGHKFECTKQDLLDVIHELNVFDSLNKPPELEIEVEPEEVTPEPLEEGMIQCEMFGETIIE